MIAINQEMKIMLRLIYVLGYYLIVSQFSNYCLRAQTTKTSPEFLYDPNIISPAYIKNKGIWLDPRTITSVKMPESLCIFKGRLFYAFRFILSSVVRTKVSSLFVDKFYNHFTLIL